MAKLTAVFGPMFAGKTTWIIQKIEELNKSGNQCLVFKPRLDDRYGKEAKIHAHSGIDGEAILVDERNPSEMLGIWAERNERHNVVVIDEVMFFTSPIVDVVKEMLARDLHVIVAGLDTNFRREPFGVMPNLIRLADEKAQLYSKCYKCGKKAEYSVRLRGGESDIQVGAGDQYQPACSKCHTIYDEEGQFDFNIVDLRPSKLGRCVRIEVAADSMRVGKTTAVKVIAAGLSKMKLPVRESYEDWQHNPFLKNSYLDPARNFLDSQKWFVKRKWEQIKEGNANEGIFIQDVSPESDYSYAVANLRLGRMSAASFAEYDQYYRSLDWSLTAKPDLLVYLEISDHELIKRTNISRRKFENVDDEYFLTMKRVNREWLSREKNSNIAIINTDNFDFANDNDAKEELIAKVFGVIKTRLNEIGIL